MNQALSDVFIKLHITEHTGRGVPRITEAYGNDVIRINENSIVVTIPFERLGQEVYGDGQTIFPGGNEIPPVIPPVRTENPPVSVQIPPVIPSVKGEIPPVIPPVRTENPPVNNKILTVEESVEDKILAFCVTAKNILEIAEYLGYKDKKSVRKYLNPLIEQGRIARTVPDKPNSRSQKYKYITIR